MKLSIVHMVDFVKLQLIDIRNDKIQLSICLETYFWIELLKAQSIHHPNFCSMKIYNSESFFAGNYF